MSLPKLRYRTWAILQRQAEALALGGIGLAGWGGIKSRLIQGVLGLVCWVVFVACAIAISKRRE